MIKKVRIKEFDKKHCIYLLTKYICLLHQFFSEMGINRIKAVLAEKNIKNKWLAKRLDKNPTTVSKWCTNESQPSLETLVEIAKAINIDVRMLINQTEVNGK